jgi:hypothetical protein
MSKLYVTANTDAIKTLRTARGHHWAKATVQSWEGSLQVTLDADGNAEVRLSNTSDANPSHVLWSGKMSELTSKALRFELII